jgi:hypothetical protein
MVGRFGFSWKSALPSGSRFLPAQAVIQISPANASGVAVSTL